MTPDEIVARLEAAGATLLALRIATGPQEPRSGMPEPVREVSASYGWSKLTPRPAVPCGAAIDAMDEALSWVQFIPADRYVLRRIVNARALVSPTTQRHVYAWSAIARLIGCDRKAVQRWHAQGIAYIAEALGSPLRAGNARAGIRQPPRARRASSSLPAPRHAA